MKPWPAFLATTCLLLAGCADPTADATTQDAHDDGAPAPQAQPTAPAAVQANQTTPPPSNATTPPASPAPASPANATPPEPPGPKPVWGDPNTADLYPGITLANNGCTTNFLFTSLDNRHIYLGGASHCFTSDEGDSTSFENSPCDEENPDVPFKPGESVFFYGENATVPNMLTGTDINKTILDVVGTLVYNSFYTMRQNHEDPLSALCGGNDFALIELPLSAQGRITPHFRKWGPATGIAAPYSIKLLDPVIAYGHSPYWMGIETMHPKQGYVSRAPEGDDRSFSVTVVPPGIFGDSGSAVMTEGRQAAGIIRTLGVHGTNGVVLLSKTLEYMEAHTPLRVKLAEP